MADTATKNDPGTDLTKRNAQLELLHNVILGDAELPEGADPEAMSRAIMERLLASDSFEDVFTQQNLTPWRSMLGREVLVTDVHFNRSTVEDGSGVYAVCDLVDVDTGETISVTCGGKNVLAQLVAGLKNGWLGPDADEKRPVRMIENQTANGFKVLWLESV